jgi:hypothetical protein
VLKNTIKDAIEECEGSVKKFFDKFKDNLSKFEEYIGPSLWPKPWLFDGTENEENIPIWVNQRKKVSVKVDINTVISVSPTLIGIDEKDVFKELLVVKDQIRKSGFKNDDYTTYLKNKVNDIITYFRIKKSSVILCKLYNLYIELLSERRSHNIIEILQTSEKVIAISIDRRFEYREYNARYFKCFNIIAYGMPNETMYYNCKNEFEKLEEIKDKIEECLTSKEIENFNRLKIMAKIDLSGRSL